EDGHVEQLVPIAFDQARHDVYPVLFCQLTEVSSRRTRNAFRTVCIARTNPSVSQSLAEDDQVGFAARGLLDEWRKLAARIDRRFRAVRAVMHGRKTNFARWRRFRRKEGNIAPVNLAVRRPQKMQLDLRLHCPRWRFVDTRDFHPAVVTR